LENYKPLLQEFWREGLFQEMDKRYFRLINRAPQLGEEIRWESLNDYSPYETFRSIFNGPNVRKESYFDLMTHFDFKTLLPALLHVEDRMSMAHGLESRVPMLDHPLVEFAATIPADIKFKDGMMKRVLKDASRSIIPEVIYNRKDKMGFPTPLTEWIKGAAHDFVCDILSTKAAQERTLVDNRKVAEKLSRETRFGRNIWGLLCLELWQQAFHDQEARFKELISSTHEVSQ
jgi:asparagine synthase (glutamine-hydrolysing)